MDFNYIITSVQFLITQQFPLFVPFLITLFVIPFFLSLYKGIVKSIESDSDETYGSADVELFK